MDPAVAAVMASGLVAIVAIIAPIITALITDSLKWRREQKAAEAETLAQSTIEVLDRLADFRSGNPAGASGTTHEAAYSDLLGRYYKWELAILASGRNVDQQRLVALRHLFEEIGRNMYGVIRNRAPELADEIIQIARMASTKRGWLDESAED